MKYAVIDDVAIEEIVANRFLQSIEFEQGKTLLAVLQGQVRDAKVSASLKITRIDDGMFFTGATTSTTGRYLVIDEEQSGLISTQSPTDALFSFQKLLRFAKKVWQGLSLTHSERLISGSSKAVLFPHRYSQAPFRIVIEREPFAERLEKRGQSGRWLLVYKTGHEGGDASREQAGLTNFRKAFDGIPKLKKTLADSMHAAGLSDAEPNIDQMQVMQLESNTSFGTNSLYRRYEDWLPLLTEQQRKFVTFPITKPTRIEGAAGTGKTLALILKGLHSLRDAKTKNESCHIVFVTHSDSTKRTIEGVVAAIDSEGFVMADRRLALQSLKVCTLSELCADVLRQSISESEFIDRDAMESKELQLLYISEAVDRAMKEDFAGHSRFMTPESASFLEKEERWNIVTMLQHEISVIIKGRAAEDLDRYKKVPPLKYGLPIQSSADKGFVFTIFRFYHEHLNSAGQFDTDDVVLTTIGQLDTPIWRRRRARDGYDAVLIDETHLFNINELQLFHYFTRVEGPYPIAYSVDRSQAVGDKGWSTEDIANTLAGPRDGSEQSEIIRTVFRSSADIVNLAFAILSSGATLFTNFDNPMETAASGFTEVEERLCAEPIYYHVANEQELIDRAFERAEALQKELNCRRSDILIVSLNNNIVADLAEHARNRNKPTLLLTKRGDATAVGAAREASQLVLGHADFVGGLEFQGVVIVGVDAGRVPPTANDENFSSKNFLSYVSHNRLYVAVSRARYRVEFLGEKARGPSRLLASAMDSGLLKQRDI
ncbi:superfamily I DNA/RNA helicase [Bradyrhizobium barranii subsp. barranii]|uniref:UvrD-helicase domain-containing protein n=1 Tax=Bradyrhizobium TaxID=374 RepID=UPI00040CE85B|nr:MULTISPECIES: UvrD-helicase domain-containing protein [Bradyrhizobium]MBR0999623.1 UvrD-helicase domain-containing protein [Bradyrhizobium liaoningense]MBR1065513.1 UvrD-helicase domain-containing protein [Bradyrhizobium liaoningense]MCP1747208.1 superfamily I DNA/RNA helicase [Bradyrhizobium japonicum]MCP1774688.1 superfamily I DNA/RNA helicase [Bradyrhizobium japonicum]MCP1865534.1 superfamily I DNA/RNA helicase [Bradyrhizobium japonicum]